MPLSDTAIRSAKLGPKPIKLADEKGIFLLLQPSGERFRRLKYRFGGKDKKLSIGTYPDLSLKEARRRKDEARSQTAEGQDPSEVRMAVVAALDEHNRNTFGAVAEEYLKHIARSGRKADWQCSSAIWS